MHDEWDEPEELGDDPLRDDIEAETELSDPSDISQHTMLSYLVSNPEIWIRVAPILKPDYFDKEFKRVTQYLIEHYENYKQIPSIPIVRSETGVTLDQYGDATDDRTTLWVLDKFEKHCRKRAFQIELLRAAEAINEKGILTDELAEAAYLNFKEITEISLEKDLGIEIHRDAEKIFENTKDEIVKPTGYEFLDRVTGGGLPCPGMAMFAGNAGKGKSVTLTNMAIQYCMQGDFVVYISLELPEDRIFHRVASAMLNLPVRRIKEYRHEIVQQLGKRLEIGEGLLRVKKMRMSGTTTANISAYLKELRIKEAIKPKILVLDYLDLLHPRAKIRDLSNIHIKDKYCAEEVYSLCEEWDMTCLTASQMVKNNSEMDPFDHATVGGGTPKLHIVDYAISLARKDRELIMRIIKGGYGGESTQLPFVFSPDTLRISDDDEEKFLALNPWLDKRYNAKKSETMDAAMVKEINIGRRDRQTRQVETEILDDHIRQRMGGFRGRFHDATEAE